MIVEDEILIAEDIQVSLIKYNYAIVGIVSSGESALEKCREIQPDLILMDIVIQGELSGIETAAKIRELYDIPVIYLTAYADEKTLQTAKITEPFGYIIKPYEDRELFATIEMAFYRFKSEKEIKRSYQYNQNIINSSLDMIISTDKDMKIVGFNKAA
ncbi:MAG: response regulator [Candidatus Cloacimonetes bacterium]|nr:response regulator [Candidatus Cloacimonadota bacterium]